MSIAPIHIDLREEGKGDSEIDLADRFDRLIGLRFLTEELIARKSEDHEIIMRVGIPEGFEFFELWSESALGRGIHDEEDFSFVVCHGDGFTIWFLYRYIVEGRHRDQDYEHLV